MLSRILDNSWGVKCPGELPRSLKDQPIEDDPPEVRTGKTWQAEVEVIFGVLKDLLHFFIGNRQLGNSVRFLAGIRQPQKKNRQPAGPILGPPNLGNFQIRQKDNFWAEMPNFDKKSPFLHFSGPKKMQKMQI